MTTATGTMRALLLDGPVDPSDLRVEELAVPDCQDGDVLIQVGASAINRSDVLNVRGLPITVYPRVPGRDFAGTVVDGPPGFVGRQVWGTGGGDLGFTRHGAHAQFIAVPAAAVVDVPRLWTVAQAGASGLPYATAAAGFSRARISPRETVLVTGAAGGVGTAACAIARWRGARVIGAVKDTLERELLERRFSDVAPIVTAESDLAERLTELTGGRGIDVAFDTVGTALFAPVLAASAMGGRMVVITGVPGVEVPFDVAAFLRRDLTLVGVTTTRHDADWAAGLLRDLAAGFDDGALPPIDVARKVGLADAGNGYKAVWAGEAGGRILLQPDR